MQRLSIAEQSPGQRFLGQQCFDHAMWLWRPCPRLELTCVEPSLSPDLGFIGAQGLPITVSRNYENGGRYQCTKFFNNRIKCSLLSQ